MEFIDGIDYKNQINSIFTGQIPIWQPSNEDQIMTFYNKVIKEMCDTFKLIMLNKDY